MHRYSLDLPANWVQVPDEALVELAQTVLSSSAAVDYDVAFQTEAASHWLAYPYVLVQVIPWRGRPPSRDDLSVIASQITGMDSAAVNDALNPGARGILSGVGVQNLKLDETGMTVDYEVTMNVAGAGRVRGSARLHCGRFVGVQVMVYGLDADWEQLAPLGARILDSFAFAPAATYVDPAGSGSADAHMSKVVERAAAVFGFVVVLTIFVVIRRRKKPRRRL